MSKELDGLDVQRMLRAACAAAGGQKAWAEKHGLSPSYVNDMVCARRPPSDVLLGALGLIRLPPRYAIRRIAREGDAPRMEAGAHQETTIEGRSP